MSSPHSSGKDTPHMIVCNSQSKLNKHLQSWDGLRLFGGAFFVLIGVPDREIGDDVCALPRSIFNSASARCSFGMNVTVVAKAASASSSAGRREKNRNCIFCAMISAVDLHAAGDLKPACTEKPSWYWYSSERMRLSSSSPFFRGVKGAGTDPGAAAERWPAPLPASPCGWTRRGGCCMTTTPCKCFPDNEYRKLTAI